MPERAVWPKRCSCGMSWSLQAWLNLPLVGRIDDGFEPVELRNCEMCWSTLAVLISLVDAAI